MVNDKILGGTIAVLILAAVGIWLIPELGPKYELTLAFEDLPILQTGHYEGWLTFDDEVMSFGKFFIGADGRARFLSGELIERARFDVDLSQASTVIITIEPEDDVDFVRGVTFLEGSLRGNRAILTFPEDLSQRSGSFTLATPTDPDAPETAGVWFYEGDPKTASLNLPRTPEGWRYEGWIVTSSFTLSTGKFFFPEGADRNNPFTGPEPLPAFPGEDFLTNAPPEFSFPVDVSEARVIVSLEPVIRNLDPTGNAIFIELLTGDASQSTNLQATSTLPTGLVTLS